MMMKSMASSCSCLASLLIIIALTAGLGGVNAQIIDTPVIPAMFVFGDSYADTGNFPEALTPPYGQTWPGYPAGRFSDGRILTDYIASFFKIETPAPYRNLSSGLGCDGFPSGTNFAHGGAGVFPTPSLLPLTQGRPTFSDQIDQFQTLSNSCPNIKSLIPASVALVVMAGNDYINYMKEHPHWQARDLLLFMLTVVKGITDSIIRLYDIGFRGFAVANLEPAGCIPYFSTNDHTDCNTTVNILSDAHNWALSHGILDIQTARPEMSITILNQSESFRNAQQSHFDNNLKPCIGKLKPIDHDSNSTASYVVCLNPDKFFFWDPIHPTQAGWKAVTDMYEEQIHSLINAIEYNGRGKSQRFKLNSMMQQIFKGMENPSFKMDHE